MSESGMQGVMGLLMFDVASMPSCVSAVVIGNTAERM
jgi:hypothetical protein